ncbi:DUF465 domain-containing protein [bacterium]|nr:DUF465 domain-containing protein [bacterium]
MSLDQHSLVQEFPEFKERIHLLKQNDGHFSRLFADYDRVEHTIHRIEAENEAAGDERMEQLKKERLRLKDELYAMLKEAA